MVAKIITKTAATAMVAVEIFLFVRIKQMQMQIKRECSRVNTKNNNNPIEIVGNVHHTKPKHKSLVAVAVFRNKIYAFIELFFFLCRLFSYGPFFEASPLIDRHDGIFCAMPLLPRQSRQLARFIRLG